MRARGASGELDKLVYGQRPLAAPLRHGRLTLIEFSDGEVGSSDEMSEDDAYNSDDDEMAHDGD